MPPSLWLTGPNRSLAGPRRPEVYGTTTLADVERSCRATAAELGLEVDFVQSNHEGELVERIHAEGARVRRGEALGAGVKARAHTHTPGGLHDAIEGGELPGVEGHISNVHRREAFRHHSYVSLTATAVMAGFGTHGYQLALRHVAHLVGAG